MPDRASLNLPNLATVSETWVDGVVQSLVTAETSHPTTLTGEGSMWSKINEDRIYARDGAGGNARVGHYNAAGRTSAIADFKGWGNSSTGQTWGPGQPLFSGTTFHAHFDPPTETNGDAWAGDLTSSNYRNGLRVPVTGVYAVTVTLTFTAGWAPDGDWLAINCNGIVAVFAGASRAGVWTAALGEIAIPAFGLITAYGAQYSGADQVMDPSNPNAVMRARLLHV